MPPAQRKPGGSRPAEEGQTLVKYLVSAGLGSRRHCASLVLSGYVRVNDVVAESLTMAVSHRDVVTVENRVVEARRSGHVYLLLNKPDGYLSTVRDERGRRTVMDLVPRAQRLSGLVPAGRLDLHSTGLLLLTDDGELVNRVTHPRYEVPKEYHVKLDGVLTPTASSRLRSGVTIEAGLAKAMGVRRLTDEGGFRYSITLNEGKKREVRLMLRAVGRHVSELKRVRMGSLTLAGLPEGEVRELTAAELASIRREVGMAPPRERAGRRMASGPSQRATQAPRTPGRGPQGSRGARRPRKART